MSIFEQPDSNTKTGGMVTKINLTLTGVLAVLAFVFTLGATPIRAQNRTFSMPVCPIIAYTLAPTKTPLDLATKNPLGEPFSVTGTVQVTDQTSSTVSLTDYTVKADDTSVVWGRTVKQIAHSTGSLSYDKGCKATDPYGSNNCTWDWATEGGLPPNGITESYQGALQEDIQAGKIIVNLKVTTEVNNTTPVQFSCPICGHTCTIPEGILHNKGLWDLLMTQIFHWSFFLTTPIPNY